MASLVLEYGGTEDEAIAALLHDAVEDQGGRAVLERISRRFGPAVADIVEGCTDVDTIPKPPWHERKEEYIAHLAKTENSSIHLVFAAGKLHNVRAIIRDYRVLEDDLWNRFNGGRDGTLWCYRTLLETLRRKSDNPIVDELERAVRDLEDLVSTRRA